MDKGLMTGTIFINLQKAFDTVDHARLLSKLTIYGIRNDVFEDYSLCGSKIIFLTEHNLLHLRVLKHLFSQFPVVCLRVQFWQTVKLQEMKSN
jgi:hypothetical protein